MLNSRQISLVNLLSTNEYIKIEELAEKMDLSSSTIKNEVKTLKNVLKEYNLVIESKKGLGLKINGNEDDIQKLKEDNQPTNNSNRLYSEAYMLLMSKDNTIGINKMCESLYISRSTLMSDLEKLKDYLNSYNLSLIHLKGKSLYKIEGSENDIRKALSSIIKRINEVETSETHYTSNMKIKEWIGNNLNFDINVIIAKVNEFFNKINLKYSDMVINTLSLHIAISILRLKQNNKVDIDGVKNIKYKDIYNYVCELTKEIGDIYNVTFSKEENDIIYSYLINTNNLLEGSDKLQDYDVNKIAEEIVDLVSTIKQTSINNKDLINALTLHLTTLCNRIENNQYITNPLLKQVKREYPDAFGLAYMCNSIFIKHFNKGLNEDEIGFIAIHIESMLEQSIDKVKTVVVCTHGIGVSQLVATKLTKNINGINIIDVISESQISNYDGNIDLFITTTPINTKTYNILISPLLLDDDIKRIELFVENYIKGIPNLLDSINFSTLLNSSFKSQKDLFDAVEKHLANKEIINKGFKKALIDRESKFSTSIGNDTALPHVPEEFIKESFIVVITNKNKIKWGSEQVDVIVVLGIKKNDFKKLNLKIKGFYRELYDEKLHIKLLSLNKEEDVKELMNI